MAKKLNFSYDELKQQAMKSRSSVENVKGVLRKQFRDRLKQLRNDNLNSVRNVTDGLENLKLFKNSIHIEAYGLTSAEIMEILEEVERDLEFEFLKNQSEEYERENNAILEDMLKDINFCPVCDKISNMNFPNAICEQCSNSFNAV